MLSLSFRHRGRGMRAAILLAILLVPASALAQSTAADVAYCNRLADLYDRYLGRWKYGTDRAGGTGSVDNEVASAQCRQGITGPSIPVLERVLRDNGFTLPPRGQSGATSS
jgi:hypothetical protein